MLNRKQVLTVAGILILVGIAIFLMSHQTPPETVVTYKAVEFSPKTETHTPSASHPNSDVEMGAIDNAAIDAPNTDDAIASTETEMFLDELFFGEILDETVSENTETEEIVAVSPFGYGPYPEIPADYPHTPIWTRSAEARKHYSDSNPENERIIELMSRVRLKLWEMGERHVKGLAYANGLIYPNRPDTVYVDIEHFKDGGSVSVIGSPISEEDMDLFLLGISPPGITVLDMSEGIEPISFLGL